MRTKRRRSTVGLRIKLRRTELGITQIDMAKGLRTNHVYLSQIETDIREPSLRMLRRIANALGTTAKELMP